MTTSDDTLAGDLGALTSAGEIAAAVLGGRVSAAEVMESFADRIQHRNGDLNALVTTRLDAARLEASALDERLRLGHPVGPLAGVPFTVKDVLATADLPTTCGSKLLHGHRTSGDATVVQRLRQAGAILVGKSNCPEFAFGIDTTNQLHGRTRNPVGDWTPGGSSGGESSAVAAGMSALGVGTDFGGSVRWPAQCTAVVGLRPTIGRLPTTGMLPALTDDEPIATNARSVQGRLQVVGLLGRSVSDVGLGLSAAAGPDGVDFAAVPVPLGDSGRIRMADVELRYGYTLAGQPVDAQVADAVAWAVDSLERTGVALTPGLPVQLDSAVHLYSQLRRTDPFDEIVRVAGGRTDDLTAMVRLLLLDVVDTTERDLVRLWADRDRLVGELAEWLTGDRLILLPVAARLPLHANELEGPLDAAQFELLAMSRAITLFGLPSLSVPCPTTEDGRPVSVQVVGPPFREDLVLAAGQCLEEARLEDRREV